MVNFWLIEKPPVEKITRLWLMIRVVLLVQLRAQVVYRRASAAVFDSEAIVFGGRRCA